MRKIPRFQVLTFPQSVGMYATYSALCMDDMKDKLTAAFGQKPRGGRKA